MTAKLQKQSRISLITQNGVKCINQDLYLTVGEVFRNYQFLILSALFAIQSYGQCGREFPGGYYLNSNIVSKQGDTINKLDSAGYYHGLHILTDNPNNIYSDTNSYFIGWFEHGAPVGEWLDHCKDGSFSKGQFRGGTETSSDGKGGWITKRQGFNVKIGVWYYYDKDSQLLKTVRYDRSIYKNGWADKTFVADSIGNFVLVKSVSMSHSLMFFEKRTTEIYTEKGVPVSADYENFWKDIAYEYDQNGKVSKIIKHKKLFGIYLRTTIEKEYNSRGKLKCKTKRKCKLPKPSKLHRNMNW